MFLFIYYISWVWFYFFFEYFEQCFYILFHQQLFADNLLQTKSIRPGLAPKGIVQRLGAILGMEKALCPHLSGCARDQNCLQGSLIYIPYLVMVHNKKIINNKTWFASRPIITKYWSTRHRDPKHTSWVLIMRKF